MVRYGLMVNDVLPTNNTATTLGTLRTLKTLNTRKLNFYQLVKITLIEYSTLTRGVISLDMSSNIVTQSVMRQTNTISVKRTFVRTKQNGFHNKLTPPFWILTTVKVPVKIPPQVAKPAQTQRNISTAQSQEFVFTETFAVMVTSTVSMEKMKNMISAFQHILRIMSYQNMEH